LAATMPGNIKVYFGFKFKVTFDDFELKAKKVAKVRTRVETH